MGDREKRDKVDVRPVSSMERTEAVPDEDTPFRIAVLGDFSGRRNRGVREALASRRFLRLDRDNFDEILARCAPELSLPILGSDSPPITVRFSELEDFHPDPLLKRLEVFQALREMREALTDTATYSAVAKRLLGVDSGSGSPLEEEIGKAVEDVAAETPGDLLNQVLGVTEDGEPGARTREAPSKWDSFLREVVTPHLEPKGDPRQTEMVEATDAAIGEMMRRILHHPDFQALEAAWRGLGFLVSRLETDEKLELYILDVSKEEFMADLSASEDLRSTGLYRLLVEQTVETPGGEPWALVVGDYTFGLSIEDARVLSRIARIAVQAGAPFLAEASPHLVGCESLAETPDPGNWNRPAEEDAGAAWEALRRLPEASHIGLALPRMLLRLPYGTDTEPTESFEFEEMPEAAKHDAYLWASPVFACAYVLGETFSLHGWDFGGVTLPDIDGLPLHVYRERGESHAKPCAEVTLTEEAVRIMLDRGVMPLVSFKNQDKVRLASLQSLANPEASLAGRWSTIGG